MNKIFSKKEVIGCLLVFIYIGILVLYKIPDYLLKDIYLQYIWNTPSNHLEKSIFFEILEKS